MDLSKINRVEIIDENGRAYTNYNVNKCELSLQDDNRTLKVFVKSNNKKLNMKVKMKKNIF